MKKKLKVPKYVKIIYSGPMNKVFDESIGHLLTYFDLEERDSGYSFRRKQREIIFTRQKDSNLI